MIKKPYKATDWNPDLPMVFPVVLLPKVDGVRGLHNHTNFCSRTFEPFANKFTQARYDIPLMAGFDMELAAGPPTSTSLCRDTTSVLNTITGQPYIELWVFDWLSGVTQTMGYLDRLRMAHSHIDAMKANAELREQFPQVMHLRKMPYRVVNSYAELQATHDEYVKLGYEGSILRSVDGVYKFGRATEKEGGYLRIKNFAHDEIIVTAVTEGKTNLNDLEVDNVGYAKRSTHKENMIPNGMIGNLIGRTVKDIRVNGGTKVIPVGTLIEVGAGKLTHDEREYYFKHQDEIVGQCVKFQHFPHGVKDKLRFGTFQNFRPAWDMPQD